MYSILYLINAINYHLIVSVTELEIYKSLYKTREDPVSSLNLCMKKWATEKYANSF